VAACTETDEAAILTVMTKKKATSYSLSNLIGSWRYNVLETPGPYWEKGVLTVVSDNTFTLDSINSLGEVTTSGGTWSFDETNDSVTITPTEMPGGFTCSADAGETVIACVFSVSASSTNLLVMTKTADSYSLTDDIVNSSWHTHALLAGIEEPFWSHGVAAPQIDGTLTISGETSGGSFTGKGIAEISVSDGIAIYSWDASEGCSYQPVRRDSIYYFNTIQGAYESSDSDNQTVQVRTVGYYEALNLANTHPATLKGGYACDYSEYSGNSIINGKAILSGAAVTMDGITIK
jgi:hypothetical protein